MDDALRDTVAQRAAYRCEYCHLREQDDVFAFHVEHIIARMHGGTDELDNLAYACQHCNLHKGPNLAGIDPLTDIIVPLFHPRQQDWTHHFIAAESQVVGQTAIGRATVRVLAMNDSDRVNLRAMLAPWVSE